MQFLVSTVAQIFVGLSPCALQRLSVPRDMLSSSPVSSCSSINPEWLMMYNPMSCSKSAMESISRVGTVKCLIFERAPMLVALFVPSADFTTRKYTMELRNLLPSDIPKIAVGFSYCLHTHLGQGLIS